MTASGTRTVSSTAEARISEKGLRINEHSQCVEAMLIDVRAALHLWIGMYGHLYVVPSVTVQIGAVASDRIRR
jgi:hypothetical protein